MPIPFLRAAVLLPILSLLVAGAACRVAAQTAAEETILRDKRIYLYLSKKQIEYDPAYGPALWRFVQSGDSSADFSEASLKLGVSARLGEMLAARIRRDLHASEVVFVNADPALGPAFVAAFSRKPADWRNLKKTLPADADYVLTVDSCRLFTEQRRDLFTYSNRIFSQARSVRMATVDLALWNPQTGAVIARTRLHFDESDAPDLPPRLQYQAEPTPGGQYLARIFDIALTLLLEQAP